MEATNSLGVSAALTIILLLAGSDHAFQFWPDTYVTITDDIARGVALTVHCKSKEDDLGAHVLRFGERYWFKFQTNWWKSTLFFCRFAWREEARWFDIFVASRDQDTCTKCNWSIRADGPCRIGKGGKCYPWNKSASLETLKY
ncbi:PREDICTED: uncharacterized protein LOC104801552 [Tarenaya hassleriana]|uniref:uncharacterized protein LOC104801552 n=1 Tax=Tarenaya hassleriana TaxID=28532 RepID=UPI00053C0FC7|nr:PREDICTED: uncharacterized protein LOC104801552 [Tarenaya hassleriana]